MHYICEGECGGTSEKPDKCGSSNCTRKDDMFSPCDCQDGKHGDKQIKDTPGESLAHGEGENYRE